MGRSKLPDHIKKKRHTFRMSEECKTKLKQDAKKNGKSMSTYLSDLIMDEKNKVLEKIK